MKKEEFLSKLIDELDLEDHALNDDNGLHLTSLRQLSLISFLDEHFKIRVKIADLKSIDSVEKLINFIGKEKFE